jgi:hypothetical protein
MGMVRSHRGCAESSASAKGLRCLLTCLLKQNLEAPLPTKAKRSVDALLQCQSILRCGLTVDFRHLVATFAMHEILTG